MLLWIDCSSMLWTTFHCSVNDTRRRRRRRQERGLRWRWRIRTIIRMRQTKKAGGDEVVATEIDFGGVLTGVRQGQPFVDRFEIWISSHKSKCKSVDLWRQCRNEIIKTKENVKVIKVRRREQRLLIRIRPRLSTHSWTSQGWLHHHLVNYFNGRTEANTFLVDFSFTSNRS